MSVLESMRSGSDSTFMQVVLALVIVSFVFWYANPRGDQSSVVATVNGVKIMDTSFGRENRQALREAEMRYGRTLSNEEQQMISEQVRQRVIEDEVVLQEARRLGFEVSDTEIARYIVDQEFLHDEATGKFDKALLDRHLKRLQMTRPDFEDLIRKQMLREKVRLMVYTGASVSGAEIEKAWVEQNTRVDIRYVKLRARDFAKDVTVTPEQATQYATENETEVRARYDRDFQRLYNKAERLVVRMIRVPVSPELPLDQAIAKVNGLRTQIVEGADFAQLATAHSVDPSSAGGGLLEARPLSQFSTEDATALGALVAGELTQGIAQAGGTDVRLYRVEEKLPAEQVAFDAVKVQIAEEMIREEGGPALAAAFAEEQLLAKWKESGEPPQDALDARGLIAMSTGEIPIVAQPGNPFSPPAELLHAARSLPPGSVFPEVYENAGTLWVAALLTRTDPDRALFESQKAEMAEPVLAMKRNEFLTAWTENAKARATIR